MHVVADAGLNAEDGEICFDARAACPRAMSFAYLIHTYQAFRL